MGKGGGKGGSGGGDGDCCIKIPILCCMTLFCMFMIILSSVISAASGVWATTGANAEIRWGLASVSTKYTEGAPYRDEEVLSDVASVGTGVTILIFFTIMACLVVSAGVSLVWPLDRWPKYRHSSIVVGSWIIVLFVFLTLIVWVSAGMSAVEGQVSRLEKSNGLANLGANNAAAEPVSELGWGASITIMGLVFAFLNGANVYMYLKPQMAAAKKKKAANKRSASAAAASATPAAAPQPAYNQMGGQMGGGMPQQQQMNNGMMNNGGMGGMPQQQQMGGMPQQQMGGMQNNGMMMGPGGGGQMGGGGTLPRNSTLPRNTVMGGMQQQMGGMQQQMGGMQQQMGGMQQQQMGGMQRNTMMGGPMGMGGQQPQQWQ